MPLIGVVNRISDDHPHTQSIQKAVEDLFAVQQPAGSWFVEIEPAHIATWWTIRLMSISGAVEHLFADHAHQTPQGITEIIREALENQAEGGE